MPAWGPQPHQISSLTLDRGGGNPPVNIVAPSLSISSNGLPGTGNIITLNPGVWVAKNPSIFTCTWFRSGVVIDGQNGSTYKISNDDVGSKISAEVRYADTGGLTVKRTESTATAFAQEPTFLSPMYGNTVLSNSNRTATVPTAGSVYGGGYVSTPAPAGKAYAVAFRIDALAEYPTFSIRRAPPDTAYPNYNDSPGVTLAGSPQGWTGYQNGAQQAAVASPSVGTIVTLTYDGFNNGSVRCYYGSSLQFTYSMGSSGVGYAGFSAYRGFVTTLVLPYLPAGFEVWPS